MSKKYENRLEVLQDIAHGKSMNEIMDTTGNPSTKGFLYEVISIICILMKCIINNYTKISDTNIENTPLNFQPITSCRQILLDKKINDGDNKADISVNVDDTCWVAYSVKHGLTQRNSDLQQCRTKLERSQYSGKYSLGLICENKEKLTNHRREGNCENEVLNIAKRDGYLFDKQDIQIAYRKVQKILQQHTFTSPEDIIDWIDRNYLNTGREHLKLWFHQEMALQQFIMNNASLIHCLYHKPRAGKTITMLLYAKYLLEEKEYKRILIMTSIPGTIDSFIKELNKYYEYMNIKYKKQDNFMDINEDFTGIGFCSVQYLKAGNKKDKKENQLLKQKKEKLKLFDCNIFDECHFHSSNKNTYDTIINIHGDNPIMTIFASGTAGKTEWFYNIDEQNIYKWNVEHEAYMKKMYSKTD